MNRRRFLSATANALGTIGLGLPGFITAKDASAAPVKTAEPQKQVSRPNVLFIMSDQHKRSCMGVAGDTVAVTPHLDQLARESVRFTNAYCTNPVCGPSRASIMTGLYTHHLKDGDDPQILSPHYKTVAHHFSRAGYLTALVGKMHFEDAQTHGFDYKLEFNDWIQCLGPKTALYADELGNGFNSGAGLPQNSGAWKRSGGDPWKGTRKPDGRKGAVAVGRPSEMNETDHFDSFVARESIHFLENYTQKDEPFFLIASFLKPHDPFMPAKRFADMFEPEKMNMPPTWGKADPAHLPEEISHSIEENHYTPELKEPAEARKRVAAYYGNLAQMDDCAGQVLSALKRLGLDKNTIVVYTTDHGEMLGDLGLWNKFQFYEGSCGVPLLMRMPGAPAAVCDKPVSLISLTTTLADLCHVSAPACDGQSFAPLLHQNNHFDPGSILAEFSVGNKNEKYMLRDGRYKYTSWTHDIAELYDLQADPNELHNLAALPEHQQTVTRLKQALELRLSQKT